MDKTTMAPFERDPKQTLRACPFEKATATQPAATAQRARSTALRKPRKPKASSAQAKPEPHIKKRIAKDGAVSYCVQIRRRTADGQLNATKTFKTMQQANQWRDDTLAKMQLGMHKPAKAQAPEKQVLVSDLIVKKLTEGRKLQSSAVQVLTSLRDHPMTQGPATEMNHDWFRKLATELVNEDRQPQTMTSYLTMLAATLTCARRRGADVPIGVVENSMRILWEDQVLCRSNERDRRPELWELDRIFETALANKRQKLPVVLIAIFALYSGRRISEISRLRWKDLRPKSKQILVREMKPPE